MQTGFLDRLKAPLSTFDKVDRGAFFAVRFSYLNSVGRRRDAFVLFDVKERLELHRRAGVAVGLDLGEQRVQLLRVAHGELEQRVEHTDHMVVADDRRALLAEDTERSVLLRLERHGDKTRDVAVQPRAVDVDAVAADHAAFLHAADALGDGGRRQPHLVADVAQGAAAVRL